MRDSLSLTLWMLRHGRTAKNYSPLEIGQTADEPLDAVGEEQARLLGVRLRKEVVFDAIYCSSMVRAQRTLELAEPKVNGTVNNSVDELCEIFQGDAQGRPRTEFFPNQEAWERMKRNGMGFSFPNGETQYDCQHRAWSFLEREIFGNSHTRNDKHLNIGIFSHGMTLKTILAKVLDCDHRMTGRISLDNVSISKIRLKHRDWHCDGINDYSHAAHIIDQ